MNEFEQFEKRKEEHLSLALREDVEAKKLSDIDQIELIHEALPELNFEDIDTKIEIFNKSLKVPFLMSSMTAGHKGADSLNALLIEASEELGWMMGVGSQRRELTETTHEWASLRKKHPQVVLLGNIGLSQLIQSQVSDIERLVDSIEASAMIVHLNALQEVIQIEGTPHFKGGLVALENLVKHLKVPVVLKETGCGFSQRTLDKLRQTSISIIDVSGLGGTHWGRIEGHRALGKDIIRSRTAETFKNWGIGTVESVLAALESPHRFSVWASGGVRTGLDAAKLLAVGAEMIGFARPILESAMEGPEALRIKMKTLEFELRTAMFCTGSRNLSDLKTQDIWRFKP